jgi:hypothetical protein
MTRLDDRGEIIADWWRDNPGEHTWQETLAGVNMRDSAKSRAARKRACEIAVMQGDHVQYAVYANHFAWRYVNGSTARTRGDAVTPLIDPMLHSAVTASGVKAKERTFHDHMNKERMRGLAGDERELVQQQIDFEKNRREAEELHARQMRLLIRMRNQGRQQD